MGEGLELALAELAERIGFRKAGLGEAGMATEVVGARSKIGEGVAPSFAETVEPPTILRMDNHAAVDLENAAKDQSVKDLGVRPEEPFAGSRAEERKTGDAAIEPVAQAVAARAANAFGPHSATKGEGSRRVNVDVMMGVGVGGREAAMVHPLNLGTEFGFHFCGTDLPAKETAMKLSKRIELSITVHQAWNLVRR